MKLLFVLIASLMVFAPQSFAQKDDYSKVNEKNCPEEYFFGSPPHSAEETIAEKMEKTREAQRRQQWVDQVRSGFTELSYEEWVKTYNLLWEDCQKENERKKKGKKG